MASGLSKPVAAAWAVIAPRLAREVPDGDFAAFLARLLAGPGRVLDPSGSGTWPRYVLTMASTLGGCREAATVAAAAVACLVAAADVVDDLVDDEWASETGTPGQGINAAVALYALALRCTGDFARILDSGRACVLNALLTAGYLEAATGEDIDVRLEALPDATEQAAYAMTSLKSGALVELACRAGALTATTDVPILDCAGAFGRNAGIAAQLRNDLAGVAPESPARGSDLRRRKKTLPVAYALRCAREEGILPLLAWYAPREGAMVDDGLRQETVIAELIRAVGGAEYVGIVADAHRQEARVALRRLLRLTGQPAVGRLRHFVPPVRWSVPRVR